MNILHFSHESDLDGKFCHFLTNLAFEGNTTEVDVTNGNMQTIVPEYLSERNPADYDMIFITDLGLTSDALEKIVFAIDGRAKIVYIDHHPSMTKNEMVVLQNKGVTILHDTSCSAAKILYEHLKCSTPGKNHNLLMRLEYITQLVSDYDTFQFKEKGTYEAEWLNIYFHNNRTDFNDTLFSLLMKDEPIDASLVKESFYDGSVAEFKINDRTKFIEDKKKKIKIVNIDGLNVGLVFTDHTAYVSEFGYVVCRELEDKIDLLIIAAPDAPAISVRSCKENATEFAKSHGGGGHPNASGFTATPEYFKELFDLYTKYGVKAYL